MEGFRVLNLARDRGLAAGKMLADLGADVIKVERPEGDPARRLGPFKDDIPGQERSLYFLNFCTNQRGVTLNLQTAAGRDIFKQLVNVSDVVLEDFQPGVMESVGLGYPVLREVNARIVMTSITGFGPAGPFKEYKAPDLVSFAMGGMMFLSGDPAKPPVVAPCEQAYYSVCLLASFGTLTALFNRTRTGSGRLVEISTHEAMAIQEHLVVRYSLESDIVRRVGSQHTTAPSRIYPCKDGPVYVFAGMARHWKRLLEMMGHPETLMDPIWDDSRFRRENVDVIDPIVTEFTMKHTRAELVEKFQSSGIPCTPVNTPEEFVNDPQIQSRGFIAEMTHPVIGKSRYLAPPYKFTDQLCGSGRAAPLLGQHNQEIYCRELGLSPAELEGLRDDGVI